MHTIYINDEGSLETAQQVLLNLFLSTTKTEETETKQLNTPYQNTTSHHRESSSIRIYILPLRSVSLRHRTATMLPYQQTSRVIPFNAIWCIGFLIACANLPCHLRGERHGETTYRWPPRPFREVALLRPVWPVVFLLPAVLWPVWLVVTVVRQHTARDVGDE